MDSSKEATKKIIDTLIKNDPDLVSAIDANQCDEKNTIDPKPVLTCRDQDNSSREGSSTKSVTSCEKEIDNSVKESNDSYSSRTEETWTTNEESLEIELVEDETKPHFDRCYAKIINLLKGHNQAVKLGNDFSGFGNDKERVKFVRGISFVDEVIKINVCKSKKNFESAVTRRETGNGMFKKGYYADAHELYTQSVQLFPKDLDNQQKTELAKSFANRATTACHMNEYRACLVDIDRAFELDYPDHLKHKIYEKQAKCFRHLKDYDRAVSSLKSAISSLEKQKEMPKEKRTNIISDLKKQLANCESLARDAGSNPIPEEKFKIPHVSKQPHETLVNASSLIDMKYSESLGRHGVAKKEIKVGDVLVVEKPYASVVLPPFYDTHCYYCYKRAKSAIGCDHCTTVRFCGRECKDKAFDEFHFQECGLLNYIDSTDHCWGHLAYRIVIRLGFEKLLEFFEYCNQDGDTKWSMLGANGGRVDSDDYKCVHSLLTHASKRSESDLFYRALKATYLLKCLLASNFFPSTNVSEDVVNFAGGLLLSNLQLCPCNAHEISELNVQTKDLSRTKTSEIGAGLYPTLSLLNHSCDPNVVRYFYGNVCVTRAIHHIRKGDEIVDNYGALYPTQKLEERQKHLGGQYFFSCECKPCREDWPLYNEMLEGEDAPPVLKCESCGEALLPVQDVHSKDSLEEYACESCGRKHNIVQRMQALDHSHDRFAAALESVVMGDRSAVGSLEDHLDLMDRLLHLPWKMFNNAQEALKHNYGVSGNCHTIN